MHEALRSLKAEQNSKPFDDIIAVRASDFELKTSDDRD